MLLLKYDSGRIKLDNMTPQERQDFERMKQQLAVLVADKESRKFNSITLQEKNLTTADSVIVTGDYSTSATTIVGYVPVEIRGIRRRIAII